PRERLKRLALLDARGRGFGFDPRRLQRRQQLFARDALGFGDLMNPLLGHYACSTSSAESCSATSGSSATVSASSGDSAVSGASSGDSAVASGPSASSEGVRS